MDGLELLVEARAAGLEVRAEGDRLVIRGPRKAEALAKRLLDNKNELLALLRDEQAKLALEREPIQAEGSAPPGYLEGDSATDKGTRQLEARGWMPIWSEALGEPVIVAMDELAAKKAPRVYPIYTAEEMHAMAGLSPEEQRKLHEAKKLFGGRLKGGKEKGYEQKGAHVGSLLERGDERAGGLHRFKTLGCPGGAEWTGDHDGPVRDPETGPGDLRGQDPVTAGSPGAGDAGLKEGRDRP